MNLLVRLEEAHQTEFLVVFLICVVEFSHTRESHVPKGRDEVSFSLVPQPYAVHPVTGPQPGPTEMHGAGGPAHLQHLPYVNHSLRHPQSTPASFP